MVRRRILQGANDKILASQPRPFGAELDRVACVQRVAIWLTKYHEGFAFIECRIFGVMQPRKTVRVPGY